MSESQPAPGMMAVNWIVFSLWPLTVFVGQIGGHSLFSCEPITLRMCQDLPYNTTFMPNLLNHYDQQTAALAMEPFHPMVNLDCSRDFRPFLCALYAPICMEYGRVTLPCRRLCQRAHSECAKLMEMFGVAWPEDMECSRCAPAWMRCCAAGLQADRCCESTCAGPGPGPGWNLGALRHF
ncbi:Frizzled-3 [Galemys pyrenaicus]|uniref:Frizzled-3 n=1 Tax=Galemys pyrenaicus TaxID=202257 RepID=A0A8J5ZIM1_GALPY|nr:Frizzled-3 [Galemys pyrenaicus]